MRFRCWANVRPAAGSMEGSSNNQRLQWGLFAMASKQGLAREQQESGRVREGCGLRAGPFESGYRVGGAWQRGSTLDDMMIRCRIVKG